MFIKCILSPISSYIPSPSSLMDLGSETAKHCIVSYFCCWGSCSCESSWFSLCGFTSIRQLNVWLFLLGPSLDQGTPFTTEKERSADEAFFSVASCEFYCNQILHNREAEEVHWRSNRGYNSARERHKESKTEKNWNQNKCEKWESGCWVELSNEQLEHWALCHPSTAMYHSQASICVPTTTS